MQPFSKFNGQPDSLAAGASPTGVTIVGQSPCFLKAGTQLVVALPSERTSPPDRVRVNFAAVTPNGAPIQNRPHWYIVNAVLPADVNDGGLVLVQMDGMINLPLSGFVGHVEMNALKADNSGIVALSTGPDYILA